MTTYHTRRTPFSSEQQWSLEGETLTIQQEKHPTRRIALAEVAEVRLEYAPSRFEWNSCLCRLKLRDGSKLVCLTEGAVDGPAQSGDARSYIAFVRELHRLLSQHAPGCEFWAGAAPRSYFWQTVLLVFAALMAVGAVVFFMRVGWSESSTTKVLAALALLPVAFLWISRNRPRRYSPDQIPGEVLPRDH